MAETKLLRECTKYLSSEGIYYTKSTMGVLACINGQFVMFEFGETTSPRKLTTSGGLSYRPRSLRDFINKVRAIQDKNCGGK